MYYLQVVEVTWRAHWRGVGERECADLTVFLLGWRVGYLGFGRFTLYWLI